ncbi:copper resistance protein NlpE N-terminal domain-containing protein [Empedobacter falsenii]|uniref:Copper resistance protein NlpE N-terminal domain-containing protein n=1 Tax=Empedobacter falsenii TaxID=343874 RepID=A0ABY8V3G7_9FLAO|nr:copper resistance protein NlpE N-terminal domain-containing protein [Empedobacter falsenii]WIH96066.1 copper resistance protein NlpE N-terminal domain-containing protein [Empedobacter falsenii]
MKKIFLATFTIAAFVVSSCKNETESVNKEVENANDSLKMDTLSMEKSIQFDGIYKGTLPCFEKDCKEIEMEIKLLPNKGYVYSTKRLGLDKMAIMTTGTFQFKEDGNTIVFPEIANVPNAFLVEEGKITQLNKNQKKIESADSAKFVLTKEK